LTHTIHLFAMATNRAGGNRHLGKTIDSNSVCLDERIIANTANMI
jgi:hypothetical protein